MRKYVFYGAGLIGLYIAVAYATGFGKDVTATAGGVSQVVKTFQGR